MVYEYNINDIVGQTINISLGSSVPYTIFRFNVTSYNNNYAYIRLYMYLQHNYSGIGNIYSYRCDKNGSLVQNYGTREDLRFSDNNPINISYYGASISIPLDTETTLYQGANTSQGQFNGEIKLKLNSHKLKFNNTNINDVYFNGTKANHIYFNGTQIQ